MTYTALPDSFAISCNLQQTGSGIVVVTDVGATLYSEPASETVTTTGPPLVSDGVKIKLHVGGCPVPEFVSHGGGVNVQVGRDAAKVSWHKVSTLAVVMVGTTL